MKAGNWLLMIHPSKRFATLSDNNDSEYISSLSLALLWQHTLGGIPYNSLQRARRYPDCATLFHKTNSMSVPSSFNLLPAVASSSVVSESSGTDQNTRLFHDNSLNLLRLSQDLEIQRYRSYFLAMKVYKFLRTDRKFFYYFETTYLF
jgi:hypothetical protein